MGVTVEFENDRVRVLRSRHSPGEQHPPASRSDRVIIYLNDGNIGRAEGAGQRKQEEIGRKFGEVVWRNRSQHQIQNLKDAAHEVIIIELK